MRRSISVVSTLVIAAGSLLFTPIAAFANTCTFDVADDVADLKGFVSAPAGTCDVIEFTGTGTAYLLTAADGLQATKSLTLREAEGSNVFISGNSQAQILRVVGTHTLTIEGLGFTSGKGHLGGAIHAPDSDVNLTDTYFVQNVASDGLDANNDPNPSSGGAVAAKNVVLNGTNTFLDNVAPNTSGSYGGAIYVTGTVSTDPAITADTTFGGNSAFDGGAIWAQGKIAFRNLKVVSSSATSAGGALYSNTEVEISGVSEISNSTSGSVGGGIYSAGLTNTTGTLRLVKITGGNDGGAIWTQGATLGDIIASEVVSSGDGGVIYSTGAVTAASLNATDTSAAGDGGVVNSLVKLTVTGDTTITKSTAGLSGGAFFAPVVELNNIGAQESTATDGVGGVIAATTKVDILGDASFFKTFSDGNGGAIYASGGTTPSVTISGRLTSIQSSSTVHEVSPQSTNTGGGVIYVNGDLTLGGSTIVSESRASARGGAFEVRGKMTSTSQAGLIVDSQANNGGCVYVQGGAELSKLSMTNCIARLGYGGAIWSGGEVRLSSATIRDSKALGGSVFGGGVYISAFGAGGLKVLGDVRFIGNHSDESGGAISDWSGELVVTDAVFEKNTANRLGGAIHSAWASDVEITRSSFVENTAVIAGGAIDAIGLSVNSSLFFANKVTDNNGEGGAILNREVFGTQRIVFSTFIDNETAGGRGDQLSNLQGTSAFEIFGSIFSSTSQDQFRGITQMTDVGGNLFTSPPNTLNSLSRLTTPAEIRLSEVVYDSEAKQYVSQLREGSLGIGLISQSQVSDYLANITTNNPAGLYLQGVIDDTAAGLDLLGASRAGESLNAGAVASFIPNPPPGSYLGPILSEIDPERVTAGDVVSVSGQRLDSITKIEIEGFEVEILTQSATELTFTTPVEVSTKQQDLVVHSSFGRLVVQQALHTTAAMAEVEDTGLRVFTKKISDSAVKIYAINPISAGKIQFKVNGREIAWVRAEDSTDSKLRFANNSYYLVRTVELTTGKNAIEIFVEGERVRRAAYTY